MPTDSPSVSPVTAEPTGAPSNKVRVNVMPTLHMIIIDIVISFSLDLTLRNSLHLGFPLSLAAYDIKSLKLT